VVIVQILIGTEQLTPPHGKAATSLPHGEVGIADHPIDAVIATLQKLAIQKLS
jgi:hypothetical protein